MRILIATGIYPPDIGGPATVTPAFARACLQRGWQVEVVTYGDEKTDRTQPWSLTVVPKHQHLLLRYVAFAWRIARQARQADVVFLQGSFAEGLPGTLGALFARRPTLVRIPGGFAWEKWQLQTGILVSLEDFLSSHVRRPLLVSLMDRVEGWVARHAQRVFIPSHYISSLLLHWNVPVDKTRVIYNLPQRMECSLTQEEARTQLHLPQGKRILLTIARGIQTKRVDFLVRLLPHLPDTILISLGEGEQYEGWRRYAEQQGVSDRFITPGRIQNAAIAPYAKAADAFVLASHTENYPFAAIEMVLAGLPAFLSDRGGNTEAGKNFPERVRILPYEDERAWLAALSSAIPSFAPVDISGLPNMVDQYLEEVEKLISPRA